MSAGDRSLPPDLERVTKPTIFEETIILSSLALAVLALFCFTWIADGVEDDRTRNFDLGVRAAVHRYASPGMNKAMVAISFLGGDGLIVASIFALALFLFLRRRRAALWLVVTLAGALVLDLSLKYGFHRTRPTPFFGPVPRTPSFPSGHALFAFCFYGVLAGLLAGRVRSLRVRIAIWTGAAVLVLAIGLSRIYLGVHYPSDVIAGYLTATIWVATMVFLDRWRARKRMNNLNRSVIPAIVACVLALRGERASAQSKPETSQPTAVGIVRVDANPKHVLNSFDPDRALGSSLDVLSRTTLLQRTSKTIGEMSWSRRTQFIVRMATGR